MRKSAQPATRGRVYVFPINLIQTQVEASSVTMHHQAYKSSCPALASCSLEDLACRCPSKHGWDVPGHWAQGWCFRKPADVYTSDKQPASYLQPVTTADAAPSCASLQSSQSWALKLCNCHLIICTLPATHSQVPYKYPGSVWKFWPWCLLPFNSEFTPYCGILVWIPFDRSHLTKTHLPHTLFPLPF